MILRLANKWKPFCNLNKYSRFLKTASWWKRSVATKKNCT